MKGPRIPLLREAPSAPPAPRSPERSPCPEPPPLPPARLQSLSCAGFSGHWLTLEQQSHLAQGISPRDFLLLVEELRPAQWHCQGRTNQRTARAFQGTHRQVNRQARGTGGFLWLLGVAGNWALLSRLAGKPPQREKQGGTV